LRVVHAGGLAGARAAHGVVVVIDVLRAFTVTAYAFAGGAVECRLVAGVEEALELSRRFPRSVVSAEVEGLPVDGIPISNSPTMIRDLDLGGRVLVQRSSSGTQAVVAATAAERLFVGSLVVASATARAIRASTADLVTLVASGSDRGHPEDEVCARYIESLILERPADLAELLAPLRATERYRRFAAGEWPGLPVTDLELALRSDAFAFAMPVTRDDLGLRVTAMPV
jgi:2-phosphosulfolactate phosphatase